MASDRKAQDDTKGPKKVRVVAVKVGFYGHKRRRVGDVFFFEQAAGRALPTWMEIETSFKRRQAAEADAALDDTEDTGDIAHDDASVI